MDGLSCQDHGTTQGTHTAHMHTHICTAHTHTDTTHVCSPLCPSTSLCLHVSVSCFIFLSFCLCLSAYIFSILNPLYLPCCLSPSLYLWVSQSLILCFSLTFSLYIYWSLPFSTFFFQGYFHPDFSRATLLSPGYQDSCLWDQPAWVQILALDSQVGV